MKCLRESCDDAAADRGLCSEHYNGLALCLGRTTSWAMFERLGLVARLAPRQALCTLDGCARPHYAKGLCNSHYLTNRTAKLKVQVSKAAASLANGLRCAVDGCEYIHLYKQPSSSIWLCSDHTKASAAEESPTPPTA
jgi:hypothetical protein